MQFVDGVGIDPFFEPAPDCGEEGGVPMSWVFSVSGSLYQPDDKDLEVLKGNRRSYQNIIKDLRIINRKDLAQILDISPHAPDLPNANTRGINEDSHLCRRDVGIRSPRDRSAQRHYEPGQILIHTEGTKHLR